MTGLMRSLMACAVVVAVLLGAASPAAAQDPVHKLGRGLTNVVTGWIEIPKQVHLATQSTNVLGSAASGIARGGSLMLLRMALGLYETVTFPLPIPQGFASPYASMQLLDYAWE